MMNTEHTLIGMPAPPKTDPLLEELLKLGMLIGTHACVNMYAIGTADWAAAEEVMGRPLSKGERIVFLSGWRIGWLKKADEL